MDGRINWLGIPFLPSRNGGMVNDSYEPNRQTLKEIKALAYSRKEIMSLGITDRLLMQVFKSGLCSGNSCVTMLNFTQQISDDDDLIMLQAIYQARILRLSFLAQCISSYCKEQTFDFDQIADDMNSEDICRWPMITIMPRLNNVKQLAYAHTIVPYRLDNGKRKKMFYVYDSNYPRQNHISLPMYLQGKIWNYGKKSNQQWKIAISPLGSLLN